MARFQQPDHTKGDANTLGGYVAVHERPAAFEGSDGYSYSAEIVVDRTEDETTPYAAYLLFVRWARIGAQSPEGHVETDYLVTAHTESDARDRIGAMSLTAVRALLEQIIVAKRGSEHRRRWWDAMHDEPGDEESM
jgi:hypothetical protein